MHIIIKGYMRHNDLNLINIFRLILAVGNLSRVSEQLGVTQPAVSRALARLRKEFGDGRFVRRPGGVGPTPRARALEAHLTEAFRHPEALYEAPVPFIPAAANGRVHLATTDYFEQVVWTDLVPSLSREAPKMTFVTS